MELDGLRKGNGKLAEQAAAAIFFLESQIRPFTSHIRVQTSRGNFLSDLSFRTEDVDFTDSRSMDDVILRAASWQAAHFVDRLASFVPDADRARLGLDKAAKVALVTLDLNLRLKARGRELAVVGDKELVRLVVEANDAGG